MVPPYAALMCHEESARDRRRMRGAGDSSWAAASWLAFPVSAPASRRRRSAIISPTSRAAPIIRRSGACRFSQATECGMVHRPAEIAEIAEVAHAAGMKVHMDGARFANALLTLGCSPAEMTWKAGVDCLSFGGTKNGCLMAEAVVFFDSALARRFPVSPQARRTDGLQGAAAVGAVRGLSGGRALAGPRGARQWRGHAAVAGAGGASRRATGLADRGQ
jgi:threonine aldolase